MIRSLSIFLILVLTIFQNLYAGNPQEALATFIETSGVPRNSLAIKVTDISNSKVLASHNSDMPLIPASIMKTVTTAALYEKTGDNWRYHTRVYIDGPIDFGYLRGNVIIVGACDPSLHAQVEPFGTDLIEEITEYLQDNGIRKIEGQIIIDESEFAGSDRPESWSVADRKKYYGTGSHAFNFANNRSGDAAVDNPKNGFISTLKSGLTRKGIEMEGKGLHEGKRIQIIDHLSPPIDEIMRSCMMRSDNLYAECFLRGFGKLDGGDGSTSQGATRSMKLWKSKGYPVEGINIVDGSGLSRNNRMTADFMAKLLEDMSGDATYASFFPLAGQEGTMKKFLSGTKLDSYIAMKTGSMTGIQCYAGYKLDEDYAPTHVIVMILNDIGNNRDRVKKAAETMLLNIFTD